MSDLDETSSAPLKVSEAGREVHVAAPPSDDDDWLNDIEEAVQAGHLDLATALLASARTMSVKNRSSNRMQSITEQHQSALEREAILGPGSLIVPDHPMTKRRQRFEAFEQQCRIAEQAWAEYESTPELDTPEKERFRLCSSIISISL